MGGWMQKSRSLCMCGSEVTPNYVLKFFFEVKKCVWQRKNINVSSNKEEQQRTVGEKYFTKLICNKQLKGKVKARRIKRATTHLCIQSGKR